MKLSPILLRTKNSPAAVKFIFNGDTHISFPRHALLCTSAQSGHFVNPLRHATNPTHQRLAGAGAVSSPILFSQRHLSEDAGGPEKVRKASTHKPGAESNKQRKPSPRKVSFDPIDVPEPQKPTKIERPDGSAPTVFFMLTQKEIDAYLHPLYEHGWSVEYRRRKSEHRTLSPYAAPSLQIFFQDLSWDQFDKIGGFVKELEEKERHLIEWKIVSDDCRDLPYQRYSKGEVPSPIALVSYTRNAVFSPDSGVSEQARSQFFFYGMPLVSYSITLRDLRFAILVDNFLGRYNTEDPARPPIRVNRRVRKNVLRPLSLDDLLAGSLPQKSKKDGKNKNDEDDEDYEDWEEAEKYDGNTLDGYIDTETDSYYTGRDWIEVLPPNEAKNWPEILSRRSMMADFPEAR